MLLVAVGPLVSSGWLAIDTLSNRQRRVEDAEVVQLKAAEVARCAAAYNRLIVERVPSEIVVNLGELGLSNDVVSTYVGVSLDEELRRVRAAADGAGANSKPPIERCFEDLRRRVDNRGVSPENFSREFVVIAESVRSMSDNAIADMHGSSLRSRSVKVSEAADSVRAAELLLDAGLSQAVAFTEFLFTSSGPPSETLVGSTRLHKSAQRQFVLSMSGQARSAYDRLAASEANAVFDAALDARMNVARPEGINLLAEASELGRAGNAALRRQDLHMAIVDAAIADLVLAADTEHREAQRAFTVAWLVALALFMLCAATIWFVVRSLIRPLRRLALQVQRVSDGNLDESFDRHGPREVVEVRDAVQLLGHVLAAADRQAAAVARGRLDDPVLDEHLPGRLGASLQQSVGRLSRSMADQVQLQGQLKEQALTDPLTLLPNRSALIERLDELMSDDELMSASALVFIDLDDFKRINDSFGHAVGDGLLQLVADRLRGAVRSTDFVARLGGDEFVVLTRPVTGLEAAEGIAERLAREVAGRYQLGDRILHVRSSVGVALPCRGEDGLSVLRDADLAMYHAKSRGKGRVERFDEGLRQQLQSEAEIEQDLAEALQRGELHLVYQPVVDFTRRLVALEALARWNRVGHGEVSPGVFVPIAERTGLVNELGRFVIDAAARQIAEWRDVDGLTDVRVAINISGRHLVAGTLTNEVSDAVIVHGISADQFVIEITETVLLEDLPSAVAEINSLRQLGVRIAIDDFGTGHSSVTMLRYLCADVVKIDRSLVAQLEDDREAPLVKLVIEIGHALGMTVVAEGVETPIQRDALAAMGCDYIQGFLIARPCEPGKIELDQSWIGQWTIPLTEHHALA